VRDRARVLTLLEDLELADAEKSAQVNELHEFLERVRTVRGTATGVQVTQADLPARRVRAEQSLDRARAEVEAARAALAEAQEALRLAGKGEERRAELFEVRARDRLSVAERRVAEGETEVETVDEAGRQLDVIAAGLQADGEAIANALQSRPNIAKEAGLAPAPGLEALLTWAEAAQAALFVARGQAMAEHDAVVRQANELGSAALGEPLGAASVAVVVRRIESATD
jgi:hypothetical protein